MSLHGSSRDRDRGAAHPGGRGRGLAGLSGYGGFGSSDGPSGPGQMPGWHLFADLTPPELLAARREKLVRTVTLAAVAVVIAGSVFFVDVARSSAKDAANAVVNEEQIGVSLRQQQDDYAGITQLQTTVEQAQQQLADLMTSDVDADRFLNDIWNALPENMTISAITVDIPTQPNGPPIIEVPESSAPAAPAGDEAADTADGADADAKPTETTQPQFNAADLGLEWTIGTITFTGTGTVLDDTADFIENLKRIKGIADDELHAPIPLVNTATTTPADAPIGDEDAETADDEETDAAAAPAATSSEYTVQATLTSELLTNLYAVKEDN